MTQPVYLTKEAMEQLRLEQEHLLKVRIPELADAINKAKEHGDLKENFEYHDAKEQMALAHSRVQHIGQQLLYAEEYSSSSSSTVVRLGSTIEIEKDGVAREYHIVGAHEANPSIGKISNDSPLGSAFLGRMIDESIQITTPKGVQTYIIKSIH